VAVLDSSFWQLEEHKAHLRSDNLQATLDLLRPSDGLGQVRIQDRPLGRVQVLGIQLPSGTSVEPGKVVESFVRVRDLVVAYAGWDSWPIRLDLVWKLAPSPEHGRPLAAINSVVSVRTELLDSRPELAVGSSIVAGRAMRLSDPESGSFDELDVTEGAAMNPSDGPGCLLFRLTDAPVSYVEMVHPTDFRKDELRVGSHRNQTQVRHALFPDRLEKGVIFRAQVRGAFLPRDGDLSLAAACYREFSGTEPPLSD
jgi:hypothetical protein